MVGPGVEELVSRLGELDQPPAHLFLARCVGGHVPSDIQLVELVLKISLDLVGLGRL